MTIYRVKIEVLDACRGNFVGYAEIGYYANKERAKKEAAKAYENRNRVIEGEVKIEEIKVIE